MANDLALTGTVKFRFEISKLFARTIRENFRNIARKNSVSVSFEDEDKGWFFVSWEMVFKGKKENLIDVMSDVDSFLKWWNSDEH